MSLLYIGSHGDKGAELSDLILPGAALYRTRWSLYKFEGKIQKTYLASYPPW